MRFLFRLSWQPATLFQKSACADFFDKLGKNALCIFPFVPKGEVMKKNLCRVLFCLLLTFTLGTLISPGGVLAADGHVTVSVEKFTLGRGYLVEPTVVPFEEGDTVADITVALLGNANYKSNGTISSFYLQSMKDADTTAPNIPQYILKAVEKKGKTEADLLNEGRVTAGWLGEFDYYYMSGWMVCSNNFYIDVSAGQYPVHDGDVIRWQFTVYGYGSDLGSTLMTSKPIIATANKDALTAEIAKLNASGEKEEELKDATFKRYYNNAIFILKTMTSSQEQVDMALANLHGTSTLEPTLPDPDEVSESAAVTAVKSAIDALPQADAVKLSDAAAIAAARTAYEDLSEDAKSQITNLPRLTAAETALKALLQAPVDAVIAQIAALPAADEVTLADKTAIEAARAAYTSLSAEQRQAVTNLSKLTAVEAALEVLENPVPEERILTVGSGGKVIPGDVSGLMGRTVVFIVTADTGYQVKDVILDGVSLGTVTKFTCKKLTEDTRINVSFEKQAALAFVDITNHWAKADIEYLASLGIVNGKSEGAFCPDDLLTRAEFVKILAVASHEDLSAYGGGGVFSDVTTDKWYNPYVNWANQKGVVKGITAETFEPNQNINRQDMAVMLYRYAGVMGITLSENSNSAQFADDGSIAGYAKEAVYIMRSMGIINGMGQNNFAPLNNATRAQACAIVHRFLLLSTAS